MTGIFSGGSLILLLCVSLTSWGQAVPAATRAGQIQLGAGFSFANPDYSQTYIKGVTGYGTIDLSHRLGVEADIHYVSLLTPTDIGEISYLIGPRVSLVRQDRLTAYANVLGGIGRFAYQAGTYRQPHTDSYGAFAIGGVIEFRVSRHISVRAVDIEAQKWPGFGAHGLTPFVTTFGVAYVR